MNFRFFLTLLNFLFILLIPIASIADDAINIALPYIPSKIEIHNDNDPVNEIIKNNITTPMIKKPGSNTPIGATKIQRTTIRDDQNTELWALEFKNGIPLDKHTNLDASVVKNTIKGLSNLKLNNHNNSHISQALSNISTVSFQDQGNTFQSLISLKKPDPEFPNKLKKLPLLNNRMANVFKKDIGKGTNMPFYAPFIVSEFIPGEHIKMIRNNYFGYPGDQSKSHSINFKTYSSPEEAIRSLRTGSISIIALPCERQLLEAKRDKTLQILPSPVFSYQKEKKWSIQKDHWNSKIDKPDKTKELHTIDFDSIITRKSLEYDNQFKMFFELKNVSRGQI